MKTQQFKTNIKCAACVAKVTPHLNSHQAIQSWEVATQTADKTLTVVGDISATEIGQLLQQAGFTIQAL